MVAAAIGWQQTFTEVEQELHQWRVAHPAATLTQIEHAVDARLREVRAELMADLAEMTPAVEERCPDCDVQLMRRGDRTRTLRTQGEVPLALRRPYLVCPACGAGVFPPRSAPGPAGGEFVHPLADREHRAAGCLPALPPGPPTARPLYRGRGRLGDGPPAD